MTFTCKFLNRKKAKANNSYESNHFSHIRAVSLYYLASSYFFVEIITIIIIIIISFFRFLMIHWKVQCCFHFMNFVLAFNCWNNLYYHKFTRLTFHKVKKSNTFRCYRYTNLTRIIINVSYHHFIVLAEILLPFA